MPPRRKLLIAATANADLTDIYRRTAEYWGAKQRDRYAARNNQAFEALRDHPWLGRAYDEWAGGARRHSIGEHAIISEVDANAVRILRVIHVSQDIWSGNIDSDE